MPMTCLDHAFSDLLKASIPPDEEMVDLIETAFLKVRVDGVKPDQAYFWLMQSNADLH